MFSMRLTRCAVLMLAAVALPLSARAAEPCGYFSADPQDDKGPPIHFKAVLSADEESAVTESPGVGEVDFTLDRKTLKLSWKLTFKNLTTPPTGAYIRGPQTPGSEAGILHDLAPKGVVSGVEGSAEINEGELAYLVQDRLYVNLHTKKYPAGELRGHLQRIAPVCQ
jgi:hypothetical protein